MIDHLFVSDEKVLLLLRWLRLLSDTITQLQSCETFVFVNNRIKAGVNRKVSKTQEGTHSIITSSIDQLNEGVAVHLPKIDTQNRSIVRSRRDLQRSSSADITYKFGAFSILQNIG